MKNKNGKIIKFLNLGSHNGHRLAKPFVNKHAPSAVPKTKEHLGA